MRILRQCLTGTAAMKLQLLLDTPVQTLVLIGGGEFSFGETREIDRELLSRMPRERRTVAFLPTASGSPEYALHFGAYLRELDPSIDVVNVPIYRGRDSRRPKNIDVLRAAGLVYLGGGVTTTLLETLLASPAEAALRDAARSGAVVAAIGAAASCFGSWTREARGTSATPGLGWISETAIEAPFDPADDVTLRRLMSRPDVAVGVGIPAATAIVLGADGASEVLGDGQIAVFRKA